jgi:DNA (cytosine-5)-methyltransferase 1
MLKHGSFCTGYGGLDMAVEHFYDAETVWHSEIDKHCSQLLEKHGYANNLGDLTEINWDDVEPVDIMSAGFPCQPFSHAGNRKGNNDERAIFQWISDGISVLRPGVVVLENVAGILTLGGTSVIGALTEIGYDAKWGFIRASDVGACHRRGRWFCIAFDSTSDRRSLRQTGKIHKSKSRPVNGSNRVPFPDTAGRGSQSIRAEHRLGETETETRRLSSFGAYEPAVRRWEAILGRTAPVPVDERGINNSFVQWMMGLPENHVCNQGLPRTAELKMLGNGVVPQQALLALALLNE